jgi:hypothetical protein
MQPDGDNAAAEVEREAVVVVPTVGAALVGVAVGADARQFGEELLPGVGERGVADRSVSGEELHVCRRAVMESDRALLFEGRLRLALSGAASSGAFGVGLGGRCGSFIAGSVGCCCATSERRWVHTIGCASSASTCRAEPYTESGASKSTHMNGGYLPRSTAPRRVDRRHELSERKQLAVRDERFDALERGHADGLGATSREHSRTRPREARRRALGGSGDRPVARAALRQSGGQVTIARRARESRCAPGS